MSTPRSTAAAETRRPQRRPSARRCELDAAHQAAQPDVRDLGQRHDPVVEQVAQLVRALAARWRARRTRRSARGGGARPRPRARSRCTSARGTASARTGRARGTPRTRGPTRRSPTSGGSPRSGPCRGTGGPVGSRACSDANSVPVRPNPVATSSQMSSTSCSRHAAAEPGQVLRSGELHPRRALHQRLDDHGRELRRVLCDHPARGREAVGVGEVRARAAPGSAAGRTGRCRSRRHRRESAPIVSPWYAPPNARNVVRPSTPRFTQYWNAIFSACSTAHAPSDA